jgi:hypothetical protein
MLHIIGNSHAYLFTGNHEMIPFYFETLDYQQLIPNIKSYRFCNTLAYNLYNKNLEEIKTFLSQLEINKQEDYISLLFGEVDCRWHIPHISSTKNIFIEDCVINCIEEYFKCIDSLKSNGYKLLIIGTHPSTIEDHDSDKDRPIFRGCLYRNYISKEFNNKLKLKCIQNDIKYIEVFNELLLKDGTTDMSYFKDYCHLNDKALQIYLDKFKQQGII